MTILTSHTLQMSVIQGELEGTARRADELDNLLMIRNRENTDYSNQVEALQQQVKELQHHVSQLTHFKKSILTMVETDGVDVSSAFTPATYAAHRASHLASSPVTVRRSPAFEPKSSSHGTSASPSRPVLDTQVDAATFYRQVKQVLEVDEFKQFAANIKLLNSGEQSVETTLFNVKQIFGAQRPFLFSQLQRLITQAEAEAMAAALH
jgi:hypothetical protein